MEIQKWRIGAFFLLIGILLLIVFYASTQSESPEESFLAVGLVSAGLGIFLIATDRKEQKPVERFRAVRNYQKRQDERKKEREEKRKAKEAAKQARNKR